MAHHPVYSAAPDMTSHDIQSAFLPVFLPNRVHVHLSGHNHNLQFLRVPNSNLHVIVRLCDSILFFVVVRLILFEPLDFVLIQQRYCFPLTFFFFFQSPSPFFFFLGGFTLAEPDRTWIRRFLQGFQDLNGIIKFRVVIPFSLPMQPI